MSFFGVPPKKTPNFRRAPRKTPNTYGCELLHEKSVFACQECFSSLKVWSARIHCFHHGDGSRRCKRGKESVVGAKR